MQLDFGINTGFVEELYARYLENPDSVDPSWRSYFDAQNARAPARAYGYAGRNGDVAAAWNGDLDRSLEDAFAETLSEHPDAARESEVLARAAI
jgi:2-oxoglutarate dehydrogenase E1 component